MKPPFVVKWLSCVALMACGSAQAAISCSVSSNGFSSAYVPSNTLQNITAGSVTMTCTRSKANDATTKSYTIMVNDGLAAGTGGANQAQSGINRITYETYTNGSCTAPAWGTTTTVAGVVTFTSTNDFVSRSDTQTFWGCIPALQNKPAATYSDTVTMNPSTGSIATFGVSIVTPSSCSISSPPGNIAFTYTAFQAGTASASTSFATNCTALLPYTMTLDVTSGVLAGLQYDLALSSASAVGNGSAQTYSVTGTMASGQPGTCATGSCAASAARQITITY